MYIILVAQIGQEKVVAAIGGVVVDQAAAGVFVAVIIAFDADNCNFILADQIINIFRPL